MEATIDSFPTDHRKESSQYMPTNRASMKGSQTGALVYPRLQALQNYETTLGIVISGAGRWGNLTSRSASFADTIQTRLNGSGGSSIALGGTLEAQGERA